MSFNTRSVSSWYFIEKFWNLMCPFEGQLLIIWEFFSSGSSWAELNWRILSTATILVSKLDEVLSWGDWKNFWWGQLWTRIKKTYHQIQIRDDLQSIGDKQSGCWSTNPLHIINGEKSNLEDDDTPNNFQNYSQTPFSYPKQISKFQVIINLLSKIIGKSGRKNLLFIRPGHFSKVVEPGV